MLLRTVEQLHPHVFSIWGPSNSNQVLQPREVLVQIEVVCLDVNYGTGGWAHAKLQYRIDYKDFGFCNYYQLFERT